MQAQDQIGSLIQAPPSQPRMQLPHTSTTPDTSVQPPTDNAQMPDIDTNMPDVATPFILS
jgi:hypothetical protein